MEPIATPDVVILVPGFLAFTRLGGFYYFADRVIAALRGNLEARLGRPVPVIPCASLPTSGLRGRQRWMCRYLRSVCSEPKLSGIERIHLVGHSTGGVDAQLLACTTSLGGPWKPDDEVRKKIASVVTLSSPHHGTRLSESDAARVGENPFRHLGALAREGSDLALDLVQLAFRDRIGAVGLDAARLEDVAKFAMRIVRDRQLIHDLRPDEMSKIRERAEPEPDVRVRCFVTATKLARGGRRPSDPFFVDLYERTAAGDGAPARPEHAAAAKALRALVERHPERLVAGVGRLRPEDLDDTGLSDGVVSSALQLLDPDEPEQFAGLVVADHADVMGHYDRVDELMEGRPLNAGLFHSGAGFRDRQFFELYWRIAQEVLAAIPGASDRGERRTERTYAEEGHPRSVSA